MADIQIRFIKQKSLRSGSDQCRDWESDPGHHNFQSCALPTELSRLEGCILTGEEGCVKKNRFFGKTLPNQSLLIPRGHNFITTP